MRGIGPAARWCVGAGLPGASGPPPVTAFAAELDTIALEGLAPVALVALRDVTDAPVALTAPLRRITMGSELRAMAADAAGAGVLAELRRRGVPVAVVKGPAVARWHPAGWPRSYADIDVVVPPDRFSDAVEVAGRLGFVGSARAVPQWPWFDRICREGINLHGPAGGNLDVHHHVPPWAFGGRLDTGAMVRRTDHLVLGGVTVDAAAAGDLLAVSMLHVLNDLWKGKAGLASWRDTVVLIQALGAEGARSACVEVGLDWLYDVMASEIRPVVPHVPLGTGPPVAPSFTTRRRLAALGWFGGSASSRHRLSWAVRLPAPNAVAFLVGTAVPSPRYVRDRHGGYLRYWRRGLHETAETVRGSDFRMTTLDDYHGGGAF